MSSPRPDLPQGALEEMVSIDQPKRKFEIRLEVVGQTTVSMHPADMPQKFDLRKEIAALAEELRRIAER